MGVSKNRGAPKWMIYNGNPYWNGWFGGTTIFGSTHMMFCLHKSLMIPLKEPYMAPYSYKKQFIHWRGSFKNNQVTHRALKKNNHSPMPFGSQKSFIFTDFSDGKSTTYIPSKTGSTFKLFHFHIFWVKQSKQILVGGLELFETNTPRMGSGFHIPCHWVRWWIAHRLPRQAAASSQDCLNAACSNAREGPFVIWIIWNDYILENQHLEPQNGGLEN